MKFSMAALTNTSKGKAKNALNSPRSVTRTQREREREKFMLRTLTAV